MRAQGRDMMVTWYLKWFNQMVLREIALIRMKTAHPRRIPCWITALCVRKNVIHDMEIRFQ